MNIGTDVFEEPELHCKGYIMVLRNQFFPQENLMTL